MFRKRLAFVLCWVMMIGWAPSVTAGELPTAIRLNRSAATIGIDIMNRSVLLYIDSASYASGGGPIPLGATWTTDDPQKVTLTPDAADPSTCTVTATGASEGPCTVTVRVGGAASSCIVTVKGLFRASALKISGAKTMRLGSDPTRNRLQLTAVIAPAHASANDPFRELVNWKSSNGKIATVDERGWVQALRPGTVRIVCTLGDGSRKRAEVRIRVAKLQPQSVSVADQMLPMGRYCRLRYQLAPADAYDQRIVWKSGNPRVAQVSSDGTVRGLRPGRARISATTVTGKKRAVCTVTIAEWTPGTPSPAPSPSVTPEPSDTPPPDPTDSPAPEVKYFVHAFGIGAYQKATGLSVLASAVPDAESFAALYGAAAFTYGLASVTVHRNLDRAALRSAFGAMAQAPGVGGKSVTILYFQGHTEYSVTAANHGALLGIDGLPITVSELRELLDKVPGTVVLVLDCNNSGRYLDETAPTVGGRAMLKAVAQTFRAEKYKLICACGATGYVLDAGDADSQTSFLMIAIREALGAALPADRDKNRRITLDELFGYSHDKVNALVDELNKKGNDLEQTVLAWPSADRTTVYAK